MKSWFVFFVFLSLSIVSCKNVNDSSNTINDSETHYFLDNISSRGAEMIVNYKNGNLVCCDVLLKEDTGNTLISYRFANDSIFIQEIVSIYRYLMTDEREMRIDTIFDNLVDSIRFMDYIMDYEGNIIWRSDSINKITNIFPELKQRTLISCEAK